MRRSTTAIVVIAVGFLVAPLVRGLVLIAWLAALVVAMLLVMAKSAGRKRVSLVLWVVSLVVSAVVTAPQLVTERYGALAAHVFAGLVWWAALPLSLLQTATTQLPVSREGNARLHR
jgi:hypothetical protein